MSPCEAKLKGERGLSAMLNLNPSSGDRYMLQGSHTRVPSTTKQYLNVSKRNSLTTVCQTPSLSRSMGMFFASTSHSISTFLASGALKRNTMPSSLYSGEMMGRGNNRTSTPGVNGFSLPVAAGAGCAPAIAACAAFLLKSSGNVLLRKYFAFIHVWPNLSLVNSFTAVIPFLSRNSM